MIAIVDYGAGNLTSVKRALDYLGIESFITADPGELLSAERIIFPGVGHAASAMRILNQRGLHTALKEAFNSGIPIMGICLGTQIILSHSDEGGPGCVGLIEGNCPKFNLKDKALKIPHMGWDSIRVVKEHPVLKSVKSDDEFYFVHSYYPQPSDRESVLAECEYEMVFPAVIGRSSLVATQFHPEKSGPAGLRILEAFSTWDGLDGLTC